LLIAVFLKDGKDRFEPVFGQMFFLALPRSGHAFFEKTHDLHQLFY
jgi:hypothetical protein